MLALPFLRHRAAPRHLAPRGMEIARLVLVSQLLLDLTSPLFQ
jgi:hypothetical protein